MDPKAKQSILKYEEYIHKYIRLLGGMLPDTSIDTTLFIRQLEEEHIDIPGMLDYCSSRDISLDLESIMKKILSESDKKHIDEKNILRNFRANTIKWLKKKLELHQK